MAIYCKQFYLYVCVCILYIYTSQLFYVHDVHDMCTFCFGTTPIIPYLGDEHPVTGSFRVNQIARALTRTHNVCMYIICICMVPVPGSLVPPILYIYVCIYILYIYIHIIDIIINQYLLLLLIVISIIVIISSSSI